MSKRQGHLFGLQTNLHSKMNLCSFKNADLHLVWLKKEHKINLDLSHTGDISLVTAAEKGAEAVPLVCENQF